MRLLIVDDEEPVVEYFSQAALSRGVTEVDTAMSGEDALGFIVQNTYDLITVDIRMPGVSGLEILSPLRNMCPHAIIAVISGHVPEGFTTEMAGCADIIIHKPVDLGKFHALIDGAIRVSEAVEAVRAMDESAQDGRP